MQPPCIFCDNESGSDEHLWPDWMHRLVKFAPISIQEADGPVIYGQDPEQKIDTVCHKCNNEWMSRIEDKSKTRLESMLLNKPITIDAGGMKLLTEWAVLRAMVFESIKPRNNNEQFFTREERMAFKANQTIPDRTRAWVASLTNCHVGYHGTDFTLEKSADDKTRIGTASVGTIYAGHILMQTVTEHLHSPYVGGPGPIITPPPGPWDENLVEIYPRSPKKVEWPTKRFTDEGPTGILALRDRWHVGDKTDKIKNM